MGEIQKLFNLASPDKTFWCGSYDDMSVIVKAGSEQEALAKLEAAVPKR
jgi:hypothetical protein